MGKLHKLKHHQKPSLIAEALKRKATIADEKNDCLLFNFKHLDPNQGQSFEEWQMEMILADALQTFQNYSNGTAGTLFNDKFKQYEGFPPADKTEFTYPRHVPEDAIWASMHVTGKRCLIGHMVKNVFYLVFLDKDHRFWISELKNT